MHDKIPDAWWQLAIEKVPTAICCVSVDGEFLWANLSWLKMLGYGLRELQELKWPDITITSDIGADQASMDAVLNGEIEEYWINKTYVKRDGSLLPISLYVHRYPLTNDVECFIVAAMPNQSKITHDMHLLEEEHHQLKEAFHRFVREAKAESEKSVSVTLYEEMCEHKVAIVWIISAVSFLVGGILTAIKLLLGI